MDKQFRTLKPFWVGFLWERNNSHKTLRLGPTCLCYHVMPWATETIKPTWYPEPWMPNWCAKHPAWGPTRPCYHFIPWVSGTIKSDLALGLDLIIRIGQHGFAEVNNITGYDTLTEKRKPACCRRLQSKTNNSR